MSGRLVLLACFVFVPIAATLAVPTASAGCVEQGAHVPRGAYVVVDVGTPAPGATCATGVRYYGMI